MNCEGNQQIPASFKWTEAEETHSRDGLDIVLQARGGAIGAGADVLEGVLLRFVRPRLSWGQHAILDVQHRSRWRSGCHRKACRKCCTQRCTNRLAHGQYKERAAGLILVSNSYTGPRA